MLAERKLQIVFASDAERVRCNRLRVERPELEAFAVAGIQAAERSFVPRLHAGGWGLTGREIDRSMAMIRAEAHRLDRCGPRDQRLSPDERLFFDLAHDAVCQQTRDEFLAALREYEPAAKALMALAGLGKAVVEGVAALQAAAQPHALATRPAPSHRRLRPEDFGALPQSRQPDGMSWSDRVRRAAEHPSRGVGPIHGMGEPPARPRS